jgi:hypothetical protein
LRVIELIRRPANEGYTKVGYLRTMGDARSWGRGAVYIEIPGGSDQLLQFYMTPEVARKVARELNRSAKALMSP